MPKIKKETPQAEPKKKHAPPVSLYPLTFEEAMKGLLKATSQKTKKD